jgi:hypothetical protein
MSRGQLELLSDVWLAGWHLQGPEDLDRICLLSDSIATDVMMTDHGPSTRKDQSSWTPTVKALGCY